MKHQLNSGDEERQSLTRNDNINYQRTHSSDTLDNQLQVHNRRNLVKWGLIGFGIIALLILVIVLPIALIKDKSDPVTPKPPTPAPGGDNMNPYSEPENITYQADTVSGYIKVKSPKNLTFAQTSLIQAYLGKQEVLQSSSSTKQIGVDWKNLPFGVNNKFVETLKFDFDMVDRHIARLVLTDANSTRFSIPENLVKKPKRTEQNKNFRLEALGFNFSTQPFGFQFRDVADFSTVFVDTTNQTLVFSDKFIQMDFKFPTQRIYGLGERTHSFQLDEGAYTMWASGQDDVYDDGKSGRKGLSGVHPFILVQSSKIGEYFGMFFRNSNAQTPIIRYNKDGSSTFSYIAIAGQIEVYFFIHGSAKSVIQDYQKFIGKPNLPPFWSLGWQQASFNASSQAAVEASIASYKNASLPLEAVYLDVYSLNNTIDYTLNNDTFNDTATLIKTLHANNQKLIGYLPSVVSVENTTENKYYTNGHALECFIKSSIPKNENGIYQGDLVNLQYLKKVVYIDWFNEKCSDYWSSNLQDYYTNLAFDGLWTTMNEPFGQIHGELSQEKSQYMLFQTHPSGYSGYKLLQDLEADHNRILLQANQSSEFNESWYYSFSDQSEPSTFKLPFIPGYNGTKNSKNNYAGNFDNQTLSLNATHSSTNLSEFDLHSLYSLGMAQFTYKYLTNSEVYANSDNRPFFLTRGTFASSGQYSSYAITNIWADWSTLRYSISRIMNMNMFGIPHTGADVCGTYGEDIDEELCLRWIQLATFYPLARHNQNLTYFGDDDFNRSEPYQYSQNETYRASIQYSMHDRLQYLRMIYTCLYEASTNGGTCFDPLFYYYPYDLHTYDNYEHTFMVAGAVKVSPILEKLAVNQTTYQSYFPAGKWVNLADYNEVIDSNGENKTLQVRNTVNAHLRPGSLIPFQNNNELKQKTTSDLLNERISLIINRDTNGYATGSLFLDDGISRSEIENKSFEYYTINHQAKSIQVQIANGLTRGKQDDLLKKVVILNAGDLNTTSFACYKDENLNIKGLNYTYIEENNTLEISPVYNDLVNFYEIANIYYGNSSDLNLCDISYVEYSIEDGVIPALDSSSVSFKLKHAVLPSIQVDIGIFDEGIVNVKWSWALDKDGKVPAGKRTPVEVPNDLLNTTKKSSLESTETLDKYLSILDQPFRIDFFQKNTNDTAINYLTLRGLVFDSYFNQINLEAYTNIKEEYKGIFGLGERASSDFFLKDGVYSMWAHGSPNPTEDGKLPGKQTYGVHPFFMHRHAASNWIGVFYKLAHAQDWHIINDETNGITKIKTLATGGVADIFIFTASSTPDKVLEKYHKVIGNPLLLPQWSLGWHQCRYCYRNTSQIQTVVDNYQNHSIPLDAFWLDIDYMDNYRDFTYDSTNFKDLPTFVDDLHNKNSMKFVPILDAGIAFRPNQTYSAFNEGLNEDVYLKLNGKNFIGEVWPNEAVFPDFSHKNAQTYWHGQLDALQSLVKFDGLWQDMNEVTNFCDGVCHQRQQISNPVKQSLLYTPTGMDLESGSLPLDVQHANGALQLDAHSYYGTHQTKTSHEWFKKQNKRTMIIERSSFAGLGSYGSKWLGDNHATVTDMEQSVIGVMQMNMFGIQFAGADICGFAGQTNSELCARWHQVGAFYPFSRNHHSCDESYQEPYLFTDEYKTNVTYMDIMRTAIQTKYSLIRYFYTELFFNSFRADRAFYKPLFFKFQDDMKAYDNITNNIMIGDYLKLSINTQDLTAATTDFYFPAGIWCNLFDSVNDPCLESTGQVVTKNSALTDFYVHFYEGSIIPVQDAKTLKALTTVELQNHPIDLHILGQKDSTSATPAWKADYIYINDDGINVNLENKTNVYNFEAEYVQNDADSTNETITITILKLATAKDFFNSTTNCSEVNKNDYLSALYIYNAGWFRKNDNYQVTVSAEAQDSTTPAVVIEQGTATYDQASDRITYTFAQPLCMTYAKTVTLTKPVTV